MQLSGRQEEILRFITAFRARRGTVPSVREIQEAFCYASPGGVMRQLDALAEAGVLRRGHGKARSLVVEHPAFAADDTDGALRAVPIYGLIPAGLPSDAGQADEGCIRVDLDSLGVPRNARTFALKVRGDSMTGAGILHGDIVILEFKPPGHGKVVSALIDGETTLKTYLVRGGRPYLRAENPNYPDLIPARELVIQGVMVGLLRMT